MTLRCYSNVIIIIINKFWSWSLNYNCKHSPSATLYWSRSTDGRSHNNASDTAGPSRVSHCKFTAKATLLTTVTWYVPHEVTYATTWCGPLTNWPSYGAATTRR